MGPGVRGIARWLLVAVASVAGVLALAVGYARHAAVDSDQFANRATAALRDDRVQTVAARRVTDDVVLRRFDDLTAARPLVQSVAARVVAKPAFTRAFRADVRRAHAALFDRGRRRIRVTVADVGRLAAAELDVRRPKLAARVRPLGRVVLLNLDLTRAQARVARADGTARILSWALLALALLAAGGAVVLAADRRHAAAPLGAGVALAAAALLVALAAGQRIAVDEVSGVGERDAVRAVYAAFLGDLRTAAWILAGAGLLVAVVARVRSAVLALVAAAAIAGVAAVFAGSGGVSTGAPAPLGCNGHRELCNRPLDAVALAATHNAMSAPLPGWFSTQQDAPIAQQLRDGVRGLLIDTHYADRLPNGRLRTDLSGRVDLDGVSPRLAARARRARERLGFGGAGRRGMYLCHSFCELGGTPLAEVLTELHDFLVANPAEVVVVINQDYVTPKDFVAAVDRAGLGAMAATPTTRWPTLRQMIAGGKRLVFLAENHAGAAPWYRLAYRSLAQETPYAFSRARQLTDPAGIPATCRDNRGPAGAPLLLINHWVTTDPIPRPADARAVNAYGPLLARARACSRLRDRMPNLVAVDFYRQGDVFRVVDTLNGVR